MSGENIVNTDGVIVGVDMGGTKIAAGVVNGTAISNEVQVLTGATHGKVYVIGQLRACILAASAGSKIKEVCIGIPGLFNGTKVVHLPNVSCLDGVDLAQALAPVLNGAVLRLENDARCFTVAQLELGPAKGCKNVLGITLGTGVGVGIICDGRVLRGAHGAAGEMGHMRASIPSNNLFFGKKGNGRNDWEAYISGRAIYDRYTHAGGRLKSPNAMWEENTNIAQSICEKILDDLTAFVYNCYTTFDPECIVIGGGAAHNAMVIGINARLKNYGVVPMVYISNVPDAGIIGAVRIHKMK